MIRYYQNHEFWPSVCGSTLASVRAVCLRACAYARTCVCACACASCACICASCARFSSSFLYFAISAS